MPDATPDPTRVAAPIADPASSSRTGSVGRTLIIACGALTRELRAVLGQLPPTLAASFDVEYLPAPLHNRPERIPGLIDELLTEKANHYGHIAVAYADCGTGGLLDAVLLRHGVQRLPGAHCYEFFAGSAIFSALHETELGTFFLTDYLCKHFDSLVIGSLGLDRHPELRDMYFGNYVRLVLLSQTEDPALVDLGRAAAVRLGLTFEHRHVGMQPFTDAVNNVVGAH